MVQEVEARFTTHEAVCAERYARMMEILARLDRRTEQHTADIQELKQKASQHKGAWLTMVGSGIVLGIIVSLMRLHQGGW